MSRILDSVGTKGLCQVVLFMSRHEEARQGEFSRRENMYEDKKSLLMLEEMIEFHGSRNIIREENHGRCHEISREWTIQGTAGHVLVLLRTLQSKE